MLHSLARVGLSVILHRAPSQVADRGTLSRCTGYWGNKMRTWKLTSDGLPRGNQDLGRSGNCKWEADHAKVAVGGDEVGQFSYRSETDRRRWEQSCRMSHCDVEGKEQPPHDDLKAATKGLWWTQELTITQQWKEWLVTNADGKLSTNQKTEG
jgi:hypothetical protein